MTAKELREQTEQIEKAIRILSAGWAVRSKEPDPLVTQLRKHIAELQKQEQQNERTETVMAKKEVMPDIVRDGLKIILPDKMSYAEARKWLTRQEEAEEQQVRFADEIPCFPLDGLIALAFAMQDKYGFTTVVGKGFWGDCPPTLIQVPLPDGKFATAPLGSIKLPGWEGGELAVNVRCEPKLYLSAQVKKKFEKDVRDVMARVRDTLRERSIYRGQAFKLDLDWMEDGEFHPSDNAPKFMKLGSITEENLILNEVTEFELKANVLTLIEQSEACKRNSIPLKHGCLLMGPFGTGKTLAAQLIAAKSKQHGWTFCYLTNVKHLSRGLEIAKLYAPAVVFAEDIDQVLSEGRTPDVNAILNTLDGVDTKGAPIITILTTNSPEKIEPAFLRAGRIDTVVAMDPPDEKTAVRFVALYARDEDGNSLLAENQDLTMAGQKLSGFVPAFIAEAIQKAKRYAIHREGDDISGKLLARDIELAADALKKHRAMVDRPKLPSEHEVVAQAVATVNSYKNGDQEKEALLHRRVSEIHDAVA